MKRPNETPMMGHPRSRWLVGVVLALGCTRDEPPSPERDLAAVSQVEPVAAAAPPPPNSPVKAAAADPAVFVAPLFAADVDVRTLPLSLGIETLGGVNTPIVARGTALPFVRTEVFSTAVDNQPTVEITVTLGEHAMARDNRIVGRLLLGGILPAPRGVPQIQVSFELDATGTLTIRARDKATQRSSPVTSSTEAPAPLTAAEISGLAADVAPTGGHEATKTPLFGDDVSVDTLPLSLGIETLRGENTIVLARGTALPATVSEVFSTAADNQASVEVHVVQGERALAADNRTLGKFRLTGIPPAPRGVPQIELVLTVSADGTFIASARDKATGRSQVVESVGGMRAGLTAVEITRMLADAEAAKAGDNAVRAALAKLGELDGLVQSSRLLLTDPAITLEATTRAALRHALDEAAANVTADPATADIDALTRAHRALETAAHAASVELYGASG